MRYYWYVYCKKLSTDEGNAKLQLFARTKKFLRSRECGVSSGCEKWGHHGLEKVLSLKHDRFSKKQDMIFDDCLIMHS